MHTQIAQSLRTLLQAAHAIFPTEGKIHHNITLSDDGKDAVLSIHTANAWKQLVIDEDVMRNADLRIKELLE